MSGVALPFREMWTGVP